jgi:hypothetical protein
MSLECQKCEDNFCCIYLSQRTCSHHRRRESCFCVSCQLYNIEEKSPAGICQKYNFLSECYAYKYLAQINGRKSYILQRHCINHCQLKDCPRKDEATVELSQLISLPDYTHLIPNGGHQAQVNMEEQCTGTERIESRETPISRSKRHPSMGAGLSAPDRASPARPSTAEGNTVCRRGRERPRGTRNAQRELQLSSKTIVRTRAASSTYRISLQPRKTNPRR